MGHPDIPNCQVNPDMRAEWMLHLKWHYDSCDSYTPAREDSSAR